MKRRNLCMKEMTLFICSIIIISSFGFSQEYSFQNKMMKFGLESEVTNEMNLKLNLGNKFLERCEEMLTCDACLNLSEYCGWCYSDGLCKPGNEIGPTQMATCKYNDWETSKCNLRPCDSFTNELSCVTQKNCFWCNGIIDQNTNKPTQKGQCLSQSNILSTDCSSTSNIETYVKFPNKFRNIVDTNNLNEELEQLSVNKKSEEEKSHIEASFLKYKKIMKQMNSWFKTNSKPSFEDYNSVNNPAGIFKYQRDRLYGQKEGESNINFNKNMTQLEDLQIDKNFTNTNFDNLSSIAKKEMVDLSKNMATDLLKSIFIFKKGETPIVNQKNFYGVKHYLLLENLAQENWIDYLTTLDSNIEIIHKLLQIDPKITFEDKNITSVIQKQKKLSLMYPYKLSNDNLQFVKFPFNTWGKMPGANVTLKAYLNTTVLVFQKIRLFTKGNNFQSGFFYNQENIKSQSVIRINSHFNQVDLNNFHVRRLTPGLHNFYLAYKSDMDINRNNENNLILTNTIELPFSPEDSLINRQSKFKINSYVKNSAADKKSLFAINELTQKFSVPLGNIEEGAKNFNYLVFYNIVGGSLNSVSFEKSLIFKLALKYSGFNSEEANKEFEKTGDNKENNKINHHNKTSQIKNQVKDKIKNSKLGKRIDNGDPIHKNDFSDNIITSHSVFIPGLTKIQNIGGLSLFSLKPGDYQLNVMGKFILEENTQDRLNEEIYKKDVYKEEKGFEKLDEYFNKNNHQNYDDNPQESLKQGENLSAELNSEKNLNHTHHTKNKNKQGKNIKKKIKNSKHSNSVKHINNSTNSTSDEENKISERQYDKVTDNMILDEIVFLHKSEKNIDEKKDDKNKKKKKKKKNLNEKNKNKNLTATNSTSNIVSEDQSIDNSLDMSIVKIDPIINTKNPDLFENSNNNPFNNDSLEKVQKYLQVYDKITDILSKSNSNSRTISEEGEVTIFKLPITSITHTKSFKGVFNYKGNGELNKVPGITKTLKLETEKNVLIQLNTIFTLPSPSDFEFRLYINGKDDCDSHIVSKGERFISTNSIAVEKFQPGDYNIELLYLTNKDGNINMEENEWDVISMNILLLDTE